jgi:hypothetical protein
MAIKFSVGVSDGHEDRQVLEELRRRSPSDRGASEETTREAGAPGWPLQSSDEDDPVTADGQSLWAW